jgi:glycosyltransferase involved in cell wall biosynthesis
MDEELKLSIIIPVYNVEDYIKKCYNSVSGNYAEIGYEIIFVNDGSTDQSLKVLNEMVPKNDFITIITQENQGLSGARNTGIDAARGQYILFLDSDDWLNFEVIQELLPFAISNNLDLLSYGLEFFDENSMSMGQRDKHPLEYFKILKGSQVLIQGFQPSSSCLFFYKRTFLLQHNLKFYPKIAQQDVEFTTRIMLFAQKVYFTDRVAYNYYRHSGTISLPTSNEKLKKYLSDSIIVASLIKENLKTLKTEDLDLIRAVEKNYNSVIWNLFWRFLTSPKEVSYEFKKLCLADLKAKKLYPIKGGLKSSFQKVVNLLFNSEPLLKVIWRFGK